MVVANLPYLRDDTLDHLVGERTSLAFEPRLAVTAGKDGLELIWRAAADLPRVLAPHGSALFEIDPDIRVARTLPARLLRSRDRSV